MTTGESGREDGGVGGRAGGDHGGPEDGIDELDAELRALFADDRLDLRPSPGAERDILTGAKRRRRRRAILAGSGTTLAVVAVAAGVLSLQNARTADSRTPDHIAAVPATESSVPTPASSPEATGSARLSPPAGPGPTERTRPARSVESRTTSAEPPTRTSPRTSTPVATGRLAAKAPIVGPDGYRTLMLGMPYRDAVATDLLMVTGETPPPEVCANYELVEGAGAIKYVTISNALGVVGFTSTGARTPQGAGIGTPVKELHALYPDLRPAPAGYSADSGAGRYRFTVADGRVTGLQLVAAESDCSR